MRARKVTWAAAGVITAALALGAAALPAGAATVPSCSAGVNCTTNNLTSTNPNETGLNGGTAGYYGADDNHTHYRYVQTVTVATPQLLFALGERSPVAVAAEGARLCDPNTGYSAETGAVAESATQFDVFFASGYAADGADPCVHNGPLVSDPFLSGACGTGPSHGFPFTSDVGGVDTCGMFNLTVNPGDQVALMVFYVPWKTSHNYKRISFGACDLTTHVCRQQYSNERSTQEFWEFGIGAFTPRPSTAFTAPPGNPLAPFSLNEVTCYSPACNAIPITSVSPVNPFNIGGLWEAQLINAESQPTFSPRDSLNYSTDTFEVSNGSPL